MSAAYRQFLDLTIQHLEGLKARGARFVSVSSDTLAAAVAPLPRAAAKPAPPHRPIVAAVPVEAPIAPAGAACSDIPSTRGTSLGREARESAMAELRGRAMGCGKCPHLAASRKNVVFGVGDMHSPLLFVGEAPGLEEDQQGEPFVGKAGQLLTRIIETMGFTRNTVYIANILKCRPDTPGRSSGNRKPTVEEMATCLPYLLEQIDLIQPRVIVALGATAVEGLFGLKEPISRLRGQWREFRLVPVMPTFHPAYLLRNEARNEKRKVWEDMLQVMERLGCPISEKQRGYFQIR